MTKRRLASSGGSSVVELRGSRRAVALTMAIGALTACADNAHEQSPVANVRQALNQTYCLQASKDTGINEGSPSTNTGTSAGCFINGDRPGLSERSCLFQWSASPIPTTATVLSAKAYLTVSSALNAETSNDYPLYALKRSWAEAQATWNNATQSQAWEVSGALGNTDRGAEVGVLVGDGATGLHQVPLDADGVAMVQSWIGNSAQNHGIIVAHRTNEDIGRLVTKDSSVAADRPKLEVQVSVPSGGSGGFAGGPPGSGAMGGSVAMGSCP